MTELSTIVEVQDRVSEPIMKITAMLYKSVYAFENLKSASERVFSSFSFAAATVEIYGYAQGV